MTDHGGPNFESLSYRLDESDVWRGHLEAEHYFYRGKFWNQGNHFTMVRYGSLALIALTQACVAYFTNCTSAYFTTTKFGAVAGYLQEGEIVTGYLLFVLIQVVLTVGAAICVWQEPLAAGSGIPEVKCFLNGVDIPNVVAPKTLVCKVLGVIFSVSAGLPVGKEGPMIHSGAVVANTVSSRQIRNDLQKRDYVACGAAAGVCTAFSSPIGGMLFAFEEGSSYWSPNLTWRCFFTSMVALTCLLILNTVGSSLGHVGYGTLFAFGNFEFDGTNTSWQVAELFLFIIMGAMGGMIGAIFNDTNERLTKWRLKNVNFSKSRRFIEAILMCIVVSSVSFYLPYAWTKCTPLPSGPDLTEQQLDCIEELVPFRCEEGKEYNELASLLFAEASTAIRQLFHLGGEAFCPEVLFIFFFSYIIMACVVYGMGVPSGLFVPSLTAGAGFGRLFGHIMSSYIPHLAHSRTYALIGAAAVLGGMARMTISLTVIVLECTGNESFVLPLMLTLMTARLTGAMFNDDLYHIHIHLKKGVNLLEAELKSATRHHNLHAREVMGEHVIFVRPVEKVRTLYNILTDTPHSNYPVVDPEDKGVLHGTIAKHSLMTLLKSRAFGKPDEGLNPTAGVAIDHVVDPGPPSQKYLPIVPWKMIEGAYEKFPSAEDLMLSEDDMECLIDLRPYTNNAAYTVLESASLQRTYELFRGLGLQFLPVVNRYNQIVGTITRSDLSTHALSDAMVAKKKKD